MPPRTKTGSIELGVAIREQRLLLGLTVEEAAAKSGVGSKSWGRYESGEAIRADKVRGVCKTLGWAHLPGEGDAQTADDLWLRGVDESHEAWSDSLEELHGQACAIAFAVGSDLVLDHTRDDLQALRREPRGTHIGQLGHSWFDQELPTQFLMRYDYDFMYAFHAAAKTLRQRARQGMLRAHSVLEELVIYLIFSEVDMLEEADPVLFDGEDWRDWVGEILGDLDIEYLLFDARRALTAEDGYHFEYWLKPQFCTPDEGAADREETSVG